MRVGQWVRVRRAPYQGDLAMVSYVEERTGEVELKLVPRLPQPLNYGNDHGHGSCQLVRDLYLGQTIGSDNFSMVLFLDK